MRPEEGSNIQYSMVGTSLITNKAIPSIYLLTRSYGYWYLILCVGQAKGKHIQSFFPFRDNVVTSSQNVNDHARNCRTSAPLSSVLLFSHGAEHARQVSVEFTSSHGTNFTQQLFYRDLELDEGINSRNCLFSQIRSGVRCLHGLMGLWVCHNPAYTETPH